jgi:hypothetical protein
MDQTIQSVIYTIRTSALPDPIKEWLTGKERVQSQKALFLCFAQALVPAFGKLDKSSQIRLNTLVYLGASGIYEADKVYDIQVEGPDIQTPLIQSHFCLVESQRILAGLFGEKSSFWNIYYQRYWDHFQELKQSKCIHSRLDYHEYKNLLRHKYALLYLVADILHHLSNCQYVNHYERLIETLEWFTIGYNIPNEIRGLKTDLDTQINNYAWWRLLEILPEYGLDAGELSSEELHKMVYFTGLAERMLEESLEAFRKAKECVRPLELNLFEKLIDSRMQRNRKEMDILQEELASVF